MRRLFEIDAADNTGMITIGETAESDRISITLIDEQQKSTRVILDEEAFKALSDLRYKLDFPVRPVQPPLRLSHTA
jgi:hypothetical protein